MNVETIMMIILLVSLGAVWGIVFHIQLIKVMIGRGRVPKFLKAKASELLPLLKETEEGGIYPEAPGSVPGKELKANFKKF